MINKFPKVQKFYSFQKDSDSYTLFELNNKIILRFHNLLDKLESQSQTILCTRGDSKESTEEHNNFFKYYLNSLFIVGGKSNYNFNDEVKNIYEHTYIKNKDTLKEQLNTLIQKANDAMNMI